MDKEAQTLPVEIKTAETPVLKKAVGELQTWTEADVDAYFTKRHKIIKTLLKRGIDYDEVPGTNKLALRKPGIQKLGRFAHFFGMPPVYATFETTYEDADPFREWEYTYKDKKTQKQITKKTRGFYRYRVRCKLFAFGTNEFAGSSEGECCSMERGREEALGNTIWQMAKKRSQGQAVTDYTCTSDILTDEEALEEVEKQRRPTTKPKMTDGSIPDPLRSMESKYGDDDKPSKCNFCGKWHIKKGDQVVQHPTMKKDGKSLWGAASCYEATFDVASKPATSDPTRGMVLDEISACEGQLFKTANECMAARTAAIGDTDLSAAKDDQLVYYWNKLKEQKA